ncbi:MAG: tetratricopeptide repeat protein [Terriglobia bacterium]
MVIVPNWMIHSPASLLKFFSSPFVNTGGIVGLYRPITTLTLALNYWISGFDPNGFQAFNRLLHVLICLGIFWTVRLLIPRPPLTAFFTSLLFAVHPIQAEAITYISGRADALAALFFILALYWFIRLRLSDSHPLKPYLLSLLFYSLALWSKESAITWLGVVLLTEWVYFSKGVVKDLLKQLRHDFWTVYVGYLMITLTFLTARFAVLKDIAVTPTTFLDNPLIYQKLLPRVLTALKIFFQSMLLFFWPRTFSADYSYNQIPLLSRWNNPMALIVLALTAIFIALVLWSYLRTPNVFFGLGILVITYSIVGNIVIPIGTIRADRLMYLPQLGLCIIGGALLSSWANVFQAGVKKKILHGVITLLVILLLGRTVMRNGDWKDALTLLEATLAASPYSVKAHNDLGSKYAGMNQPELALTHFRIAETIMPDNPDILANLALLKLGQGKIDESISYCLRVLVIAPNNAVIRNTLGSALAMRGDYAGAMDQFDIVIRKDPTNAAAHYNKANVLYLEGKDNEAILEFDQTLVYDPNNAKARMGRDLLLQRTVQPGSPKQNPSPPPGKSPP